jgi:hypothetical protein
MIEAQEENAFGVLRQKMSVNALLIGCNVIKLPVLEKGARASLFLELKASFMIFSQHGNSREGWGSVA